MPDMLLPQMKTCDKLKRYRRGNGLTQHELAQKAGVSQSAVAMIEAGRRPDPHPRTLAKLAEALGITAMDLLDDPGDPSTDSTPA